MTSSRLAGLRQLETSVREWVNPFVSAFSVGHGKNIGSCAAGRLELCSGDIGSAACRLTSTSALSEKTVEID